MRKFSTFLIGRGIVALIAVLFRPLGLANVVAGVGIVFIACAPFFSTR
jgi:hypothetical protein